MPTFHVPARLLAAIVVPVFAARAADRLRGEPSAFLEANLSSPVDWMPWGQAAFDRAKAEQKPVFVFVGSFTSELARAMRTQTFANPEASKWMNEQFVCVLVDADEHPDLANLYEAYVVRVKQLAGWPLNIWLTPEGLPFDGAAYLSPSEEWGRPGFLKQANEAKTAWATDRAGCRTRASEAASQLAPDAPPKPGAWPETKARARLASSAEAWMATFDPDLGGFTQPPKAPDPELLRFLLLQSPEDRDAALKTLRLLSTSAVRDPLDGGFFHYATDAAWRIPYPQKFLADQARIALAYLDAARGADAQAFNQCAQGALDFALRDLANPDGTFAAAIDATGDGFSGEYAWTEADIDRALGSASAAFKAAHGVQKEGNIAAADDPSGTYAGKNILRAAGFEDAEQAAGDSRLLAVRAGRPRPLRDERATAEAHGLLLCALSRAGTQLGNPEDLKAADRLAAVLQRRFLDTSDGTLRRLASSEAHAAPVDYAAVALGLRVYAAARHDAASDTLADRLLGELDRLFLDSASPRYFSAPAGPRLGIFARTLCDGDKPGPESLALLAEEPSGHKEALADALLDGLDEENVQAPGDQLLALITFEGVQHPRVR